MTNEEKKRIIKLGKKLERECKHEEVIHNRFSDGENGSVCCSVCGKDLGWWCPESPSHICEYYGNHERGHLVKGEWSYEGEWYDYDDCIYCHEPEERK